MSNKTWTVDTDPKMTVNYHPHGSSPTVAWRSESDVTIEWGDLTIHTDAAGLRELVLQAATIRLTMSPAPSATQQN